MHARSLPSTTGLATPHSWAPCWTTRLPYRCTIFYFCALWGAVHSFDSSGHLFCYCLVSAHQPDVLLPLHLHVLEMERLGLFFHQKEALGHSPTLNAHFLESSSPVPASSQLYALNVGVSSITFAPCQAVKHTS